MRSFFTEKIIKAYWKSSRKIYIRVLEGSISLKTYKDKCQVTGKEWGEEECWAVPRAPRGGAGSWESACPYEVAGGKNIYELRIQAPRLCSIGVYLQSTNSTKQLLKTSRWCMQNMLPQAQGPFEHTARVTTLTTCPWD